MIRGYRLQPSVPGLRSRKRSRGRKKGQRGHLPSLPGTVGPLSTPNFVSLSPYCIWSTRLPTQAGDSQARAELRGQRRPGGPGSGPRARRRGLGAREGRGLAAPPPGGARELPTAARRLPRPAPAAPSPPGRRPSPRPAPPGRTSSGRPEPPGPRSLGEAPGAGVRPSRGYITGPGPSGTDQGPRGPRGRRRGRRRSPAVDALGDPIPLQGAAELTAVGVPPLHPPAGGPGARAASAAVSHLSRRRRRPAPRRAWTLPLGPVTQTWSQHPGGGGWDGEGGLRASSAFGNKEMTIPGPARPSTSQPPAPPPRLRRTAPEANRRRRYTAAGQSKGPLRQNGLENPPL